MRHNIRTKEVTDSNEQAIYLDKMFRYKNSYGIPIAQASKFIHNLVANGAFQMFVLTYDNIEDSYCEVYRERYGEWRHQGGNTIVHNELGMRWAGLMIDEGHTVTMNDSPDFYGMLNLRSGLQTRFCGDVGQCSLIPAFIDSGIDLKENELWISVFEGMEIVLESKTVYGVGSHMRMKAFNP